jgi:hypothetical protein
VSFPVFEKRAFGDGRFYTATFISKPTGQVTYRVELFDGERLQGSFLVLVVAPKVAQDGTIVPSEIDDLRNRIERVAYHKVFVDDVLYDWTVVEDPNTGSLSFSHRGISLQDTARITGPDGFTISFDTLYGDDRKYGWWRSHTMSAAIAERAVRIARRTPGRLEHVLVGAERDEAYFGPPRTLQNELNDLHDALEALPAEITLHHVDPITRYLLAIGCSTAADDREAWAAIDDWVASHANDLVAARPMLQLFLNGYSKSQRSAIQFLLELCARVNVELGIETAASDKELETRRRAESLPWGIPREHWWWRLGAATDRDPPYDPYDD